MNYKDKAKEYVKVRENNLVHECRMKDFDLPICTDLSTGLRTDKFRYKIISSGDLGLIETYNKYIDSIRRARDLEQAKDFRLSITNVSTAKIDLRQLSAFAANLDSCEKGIYAFSCKLPNKKQSSLILIEIYQTCCCIKTFSSSGDFRPGDLRILYTKKKKGWVFTMQTEIPDDRKNYDLNLAVLMIVLKAINKYFDKLKNPVVEVRKATRQVCSPVNKTDNVDNTPNPKKVEKEIPLDRVGIRVKYEHKSKKEQDSDDLKFYRKAPCAHRVEGHYRTTKDGRQIWVEPFIRGGGCPTKVVKETIIADDSHLV